MIPGWEIRSHTACSQKMKTFKKIVCMRHTQMLGKAFPAERAVGGVGPQAVGVCGIKRQSGSLEAESGQR